jgi:hypothetical protein
MKEILVLIITAILALNLVKSAYAQQSAVSNSVVTRVGNPSNQAPETVENGEHPQAPAPTGDLRQAIIDKFNVTLNGFDQTHLKWAWEKLWDVSNTKFPVFIKGSTVQGITSGISQQLACPGRGVAVNLQQFPNEALFKYAFIHEFGHVIRNCPNSTDNLFSKQVDAYYAEKGVTYYANNASRCTGSDNISEDYAEMVALYLNPNAGIQFTSCTPAGTPFPNLQSQFPLHYNIARTVLGAY